MLVLAGVAINLAVDSNGLFAKANQAAVAQDRGAILEKLNLELLWSNTAEEKVEFLQLLENNSWADSDAVLNIQNLIGKKLTTGNGSEYKDVYTVEIEDNTYKLIYYDNEQTRIEVGVIGEKQEYVPTYTQADIDELLRYFNFDEATGKLTANVDVVGSNYEYQTLPVKLVIPYEINGVKVTDIGHPGSYDAYTFANSNVEEVIILAEIAIKPTMFLGSNLKRVAIGEGVTSIESGAFSSCSSLREVIIADSVTNIGESAFRDCTSLSAITIPSSVTSIGGYAFYGCTSLNEITIPNSVTSIGDGAFSNCTSLSSITIPDSVTSIGSYAFRGCTLLSSITIPDSVTSIETGVFSGCTSLSSITIPSGVTSIGNSVFLGCTNLTKIEVDENNTSYKSIDGMLYNKSGTELIIGLNKQNIIIGNSTTSIGSEAFNGCTSLSSITIPNSVTSIGESAFSGCTSLSSITIPNSVTSIGKSAFSSCTSLSSITIPNSVTSIESWVFSGCKSLSNVNMTDSVTAIYNNAFRYCTALKNITLSNNVATIEYAAFSDCKSLSEIIIPSSVSSIGINAFTGCISLTKIYCEAAEKPSGWHTGWLNNCSAEVEWSYTPSSET